MGYESIKEILNIGEKFVVRRRGLILQGGIILVWLVMMGFLIERNFLKPEALKIVPALAKEALKTGEGWWGIYLKDEKIGYAVTTQEQRGEKVYVKEHLWLKLAVMGTPQNVEQTLEYNTNQNLRLESFDFVLKSGLIAFRLNGRLEDIPFKSGKRLLIKVHSGGKEWQQETTLPEPPYILGQTKIYFLAQGLEKGKKFLVPAFDPSTLSPAQMTAEVEEVERLNIGGMERELYRVREEFRGIKVISWMDKNGDIWKEVSPMGLVLMRESKNTALQQNWGRGKIPDLLALTAIPVDREIPNPRSTRYLRAKLLSTALDGLKIDGDRQFKRGHEIIVRKEDFPPKSSSFEPLSEEAKKEALRSTPFIQSDAPEIKRQLEAIVKGVEDPVAKIQRIADWVYREVDKRPVVSIPSALEVLRQKTGDCNEHAVLFTALARAAGIPTQMEAGIVYHEGKFYYHAWVKVHLGSWVSVDPLLNQIPADATHIRLVEGDLDKQMDIVRVIGSIKIEVLEVH